MSKQSVETAVQRYGHELGAAVLLGESVDPVAAFEELRDVFMDGFVSALPVPSR